MKRLSYFPFVFLLILFSCQSKDDIELEKGMNITSSVKIKADTFQLEANSDLAPIITIEGNDLVVDFNDAILISEKDKHKPDEFSGIAILVKNGSNITIKNARIHGFKVAIMVKDVDNFQLIDSDLSYNYRQKLKSTPQKENLDDWMSYHLNENDEWLRYGAAVYLKNCDQALVKGLQVTGGQNGLMMINCNHGLFYNNNISFNSGIGIGLYRSSHNRVMHNRCDWNIRGYSHGIYNRGQDSAGILAYEQSSNNTFAYNSATHSGDGFFLWAGQTTMDSGEGGCNDNIIAENDFSQASNNAIEVTFSSNQIFNNILEESDYGIWAGYSHHTIIKGNRFANNNHGIAIEHGNNNQISGNRFEKDKIGVKLFEREKQPEGWGFAEKRDVSSKDYEIRYNLFLNLNNPLNIHSTKNIKADHNHFFGFEKLLTAEKENQNFELAENQIYQKTGLGDAQSQEEQNEFILSGYSTPEINEIENKAIPKPLPDGMDTALPAHLPRGRQNMLITEWGPYDFRYPAIWLRKVENGTFTFALFGPEGNWKAIGGTGFKSLSANRGTMPATLVAESNGVDTLHSIELEFYGQEIITQFGEQLKKGTPYEFGWKE